MTQKKAERVASMADKVCLNGHKGDWVARSNTTKSGQSQGNAYCVSCAKESLARHKEKKASMETPRIRVGYLPTLSSKQQVEERWARTVLNSAPIQVAQLKERLKEITQVVEEAHEVIKKTKDNELLEFALTKVREMSEAINK
jgi:hypothetical protein